MMRLLWGMFLACLSTATAFAAGDLDNPFDIEADTLEVLQEEGIATFAGHVVAKQEDLTLRCDKLTLRTSRAEVKAIDHVVAEGHVYFTWNKDEAEGDHAVYDLTKQHITLTGQVRLKRDGNVLTGTKLTYDLPTGKVRLVNSGSNGRVKATIVPGQGLN